jgi:diguanylate cyclase (GGDEF)-like protein
LAQWLDGDPLAFSSRPLAPLELQRVRAAQLASTQRRALAPMIAAVVAAALLPIGMWDTPMRWPLVVWTLTVAANMAVARVMAGKAGRDEVREVRRATLRTILNAAIWAFGLALAQSAADPIQRALVATVSMSVMSGGALQLASSPPMALGFIAPLALGCVVAARDGTHAAALFILAAQLVNAGFLAFQSHVQATQLAGRTAAHFADKVAARLDPFTGLGNRLGLSEHLATAFARLAEGGERFALLGFDLDGFQLVNQSFGHVAGDELILRAAQVLRECSGEGSYIARLGGDEFALIAANAPSREAAWTLARRIAAEFRRPHAFAWGEGACSVTIGVALASEHGEDGDHLARAADAALYRAKQQGRGSIAFVDDADSREARERRDMETALRRALRNGEMGLHFQPLVDAASGATKGFEALLRWRRPGHPELPAEIFIGMAETCGCLEEIGLWALREATRVAASWPKRLRVAVNISAAQIKSPLLVATVRDIAGSGFDARRLELEIVEPSRVEDFEATVASLNALRGCGVTVALDDFGARVSSMNAIARLPLDRIKIAPAFVAEALANPRCAAVIRAAARLAKELGLALTGEGVETHEQFELLRSAGCDEAQGYLFCRPAPPEALPAFFERCSLAATAPMLCAGEACEDCTLPWCFEAGMCRRAAAAKLRA